jgi:hypothetical protein
LIQKRLRIATHAAALANVRVAWAKVMMIAQNVRAADRALSVKAKGT